MTFLFLGVQNLVEVEDDEAHRDEERNQVLLGGWVVHSSEFTHEDHRNDFRTLCQDDEGKTDPLHGETAAVHGAKVERSYDGVTLGEGLGEAALAGEDDDEG